MSEKLSVPFGIYANLHEIRLTLDGSGPYQLETVVVVVGGLERTFELEQRLGAETSYAYVFHAGDQPHLFYSNVLRLRYGLRNSRKSPRRLLPKRTQRVPECNAEVDFRMIFQDEIDENKWRTCAKDKKRLVLEGFKPGMIMWVTYDFHFFGKELLPANMTSIEAASDLLSPTTLIDILTGIMNNVTEVVTTNRLSKALDVGVAVSAAIQARPLTPLPVVLLSRAYQGIHPIANVVVLAFNLAAQYLRAKRAHFQKFRSLLFKAYEMLQALTDTHYIIGETEDDSGLVAVVSIMLAVVEVADYASWMNNKFRSRREEILEQQFHVHVDRLLSSFDDCEKALSQARYKVDSRRQMIKRIQQNLQVDPASERYNQIRDGPGKNRVMNTFDDVLHKLHGYIDNNEPIVWIVGSPGSGKTTLVRALRTQVHQEGDSTASFYFPDREDVKLSDVWSFLAYQIAQDSRAVREALYRSFGGTGHAGSLGDQFREHVAGPLRERNVQRRLVVFIDAIDHILLNHDGGTYNDLVELLHTLDAWHSNRPANASLVIASRDLYRIRQFWEHTGSQAIIDLSGPARLKTADKDITLFLRERLGGLRQFSAHLTYNKKKRWPEEDDLERVVQHARGCFLWASAARDYVATFGDRDEGLGKLLMCGGRIPAQPSVRLYDGYMHVLAQVHQNLDRAEVNTIRQFFGALLVLKEPLSFKQLVQLGILPTKVEGASETRDFDLRDLAKRLGVLRPFVVWEGDGQHVRLFHESFAVMLQANHRYRVDAPTQRGVLLTALLRWLNEVLHFDMGGIETSHVSPSPTRRPDPLFHYVIRHLPEHFHSAVVFKGASSVNAEALLLRELETFFFRHFLHWLEVGSLLGCTSSSAKFLRDISAGVKTRFPWSSLLTFLVDARSFCETFADPISFSPAHIYISALPFCPSTSKVSKTFLPSFRNTIHVTKRASPQCQPASRELTLAVGFSRSGQGVLSGTNMCIVYQWDLHTGAQLIFRQLVRGRAAKAMSFSPSGQYVALAFDPNIVEVYDLGRFAQRTPWSAWSGYTPTFLKVNGPPNMHVSHVVFFPVKNTESDRLACLLARVIKDSTHESIIRIVDLKSRQDITLNALTTSRPVEDIAASPDGQFVMIRTSVEPLVIFCPGTTTRAFLSHDFAATLRVCNVASRSFVGGSQYPFQVSTSSDGPAPKAWQLPHGSPDSASATMAFTVGDGKRTPFERSEHEFVAVSLPVSGVPRIAAATKDMDIYVWNSDTGTLMCVLPSLVKHSAGNTVRIAFSRDGMYLVSSSSDGGLVVWDVTDKELLSIAPQSVIPAMLSPQGCQLSSPMQPSNLHDSDKPLRQLYARLNKQFAIVLDDLCYADSDGWVCNDDGHRLLWVPPEDRRAFWWPRMVSVSETVTPKMTSVDLGKFVHGAQWRECDTNSDT